MRYVKQIKVVLLFLLGVFLIYLSLRKIAFNDLLTQIHKGHYWVAFPVFGVSVFGYYIRSLRWKLLLQSMGNKPVTGHLYAALSMGYAVNFATPRFGELTRCLVLKKTDNISIEQSLISVFVERVVDTICLIIIVLIASSFNYNQASSFMQYQIIQPLSGKMRAVPWLYLLLIILIASGLIWWIYSSLKSSNRVKRFMEQLTESVRKILLLRQRIQFFVYTLLIWACYFLMTYLWFGIFDETKGLGMKDAFVIMAVGSIGRSVPVHGGGMGAYHYLVSNAFALFGVSLLTGTAMAVVIHGAQLLLTFVLGSAAWIWLLFITERSSDETKSSDFHERFRL